MSWTDVFPVLDDDLYHAYEASATLEERAELDEWFAVDRVINRSKAKHLVVFSLFWKNMRAEDPDLPPLTRETLMNAQELGLVERFAPWEVRSKSSKLEQRRKAGHNLMAEKFSDGALRLRIADRLRSYFPKSAFSKG